jgi:hypothetical protein
VDRPADARGVAAADACSLARPCCSSPLPSCRSMRAHGERMDNRIVAGFADHDGSGRRAPAGTFLAGCVAGIGVCCGRCSRYCLLSLRQGPAVTGSTVRRSGANPQFFFQSDKLDPCKQPPVHRNGFREQPFVSEIAAQHLGYHGRHQLCSCRRFEYSVSCRTQIAER